MKKIFLTLGLPASGKSTWAKQYQKDNPNTVRINKDDLRAMMHDSVWSDGREQFVLQVRDFVIEQSLRQGHDVIVDDTNLHPKHLRRMQEIAKSVGDTEVIPQSFLDVTVDECIKRDLKREHPVGERVIKRMYRQFLRKPFAKKINDPNLPFAVICDIDGTLALFGDKNPYDRDFLADDINTPVLMILKAIQKQAKSTIILVSGRKNTYETQTKTWLKNMGVPYDHLYMRVGDDNRKDVIVKREIYEGNIKGKYNIDFVLDDRDQVVELWRSEGLTCLQVAEGDF